MVMKLVKAVKVIFEKNVRVIFFTVLETYAIYITKYEKPQP